MRQRGGRNACIAALSSAVIVCVVLQTGPFARAADAPTAPPANTWVQVAGDGLGGRSSPGLVYPASLQRLVLFGGVADRPDSRPYDVLSTEVGSGKWRNEFPAGKKWGPEYGPATPPPWKSPYFETVDKEGNCRPSLRAATMYSQYALDPDSNAIWAVIGGHTMRYDLATMTWQDLGDTGGPGSGTGLHLKWGALAYDPINKEVVAFGGAHGAPQRDGAVTWVFSTADRKWRRLNLVSPVLDEPRRQAESLRVRAKDLVASYRNRYYRTETAEREKVELASEVATLAGKQRALADLLTKTAGGGEQEKRQIEWAKADAADAVAALDRLKAAPAATPAAIKETEKVEQSLLRVRDALAVQPPPRLQAPMVYDPKAQKVVLFGGDRWDHVCAETWLYDPKTRTWAEARPAVSPSPRAGHALVYLPKSGKVLLCGGYVYCSSMSYAAPMYMPAAAEMWAYDVPANRWQVVKAFEAKQWPPMSPLCLAAVAACGPDDTVTAIVQGGKTSTWVCRVDPVGDEAATAKLGVKPGTVQRRTACFDPDYFEDTPPVDAAAVSATLTALPANKWVAMNPPKRFTNHDWGTQVLDPDRDQVIFWSGGHCAYCGTDPAHYALGVNRWSISYFAEQQMEHCRGAGLGGYEIGCPFTGRPFTAHTYLSYAYDTATRRMYFADKSRLWAYDPDTREWLPDAPALPFPYGTHGSALRATARGLLIWTQTAGARSSLWLQKEPFTGKWESLVEPGKSSLPAHYCDSSGMAYDSKRDRLLFVHFGQKDKHKVWVYDFASKAVSVLEPKVGAAFPATANIGRHASYLPDDDVLLVASPATPQPVTLIYDCAANEWLDLLDVAGKDQSGRLIVPDGYGVNTMMMWDPKRKLIWAGDTTGGMYVMRFDRRAAGLVPLDASPASSPSAK